MKESISVFLKRLSDILEFVISFILTAGIILLCLRVAGAIYKIRRVVLVTLEIFEEYLDTFRM